MSNNPSFSSGIPKQGNRILDQPQYFLKPPSIVPTASAYTISQFSWVRDKAFQSKDYLRGMKWPASRLHHSNGVRSKYKGLVTGFETNLQASVYKTRAISMEEPACRPATKEQESLIQSPMYSLMSSTSHLGSRERVLVKRLEYYGSHPVTSLVTHILNYLDACAWILPFRVL